MIERRAFLKGLSTSAVALLVGIPVVKAAGILHIEPAADAPLSNLVLREKLCIHFARTHFARTADNNGWSVVLKTYPRKEDEPLIIHRGELICP